MWGSLRLTPISRIYSTHLYAYIWDGSLLLVNRCILFHLGMKLKILKKKKLIVGNAQYELLQSSLSRCIHVRDERFKHVLG